MAYYQKYQSPVGELTLVASDKGLRAILWENDAPTRVRFLPAEFQDDQLNSTMHPILEQTRQQLDAYFAGQLQHFSLPLDFIGTDFQLKVWHALLEIPYGQTRSYAQIAQVIDNPKAVRAVGAANGKNPLSIVAPCHRVIGANGKLTGFAGGLDVKTQLLDLEQRYKTL